MTDPGGFDNPIVAGLQLLIDAIQSPNYVAGVSGWTINKDGTVEFNNGLFRGTITNGGMFIYGPGAPALGNLLLSISPTAGNDSFGNSYNQGLCIQANSLQTLNWFVDATSHPGFVNSPFITAQPNGDLTAKGPNYGSNEALLQLAHRAGSANTIAILAAGLNIYQIDEATNIHSWLGNTQFNSGTAGMYYAESFKAHLNTLVNNTVTNIPFTNGTLLKSETDYGTQFSGTTTLTWIPPVDGKYAIMLKCNPGSTIGAPAGSPSFLRITKNGTIWAQQGGSVANSVDGNGPIVDIWDWFVTSDSVTFLVFENSGANVTNSEYIINIRRYL